MEVYFDNSSTTRPYKEVIDGMVEVMNNYYGNPSSAHGLGVKAEKRMNDARQIVSRTLNCTREEIIFTSGGSESNNFAIKGFAKPGSHIITSKIEHPSVLNTCLELQEAGVKVTFLDVDSKGKIDLSQLSESIGKDTVLVSIMHVNNEIGTIQNIETIGKIIKEKGSRTKFHVDAVQSYGKFKIDVQKSNIDLLSASGHKIHGPRGVGIAYVRKGLVPRPLISGGGQERNYRSGTENIAAISGMSIAAEKIYNNLENNFNRVSSIKQYFISKIKLFEGVKVNSEGEEYSPYVLSASFTGVRGEVLLHTLEDKGIYVSTGSACSAKQNKDSHVLRAIGLKQGDITGTIRFSFSEFNSIEEVDYTIENIEKSLKFLRRLR